MIGARKCDIGNGVVAVETVPGWELLHVVLVHVVEVEAEAVVGVVVVLAVFVASVASAVVMAALLPGRSIFRYSHPHQPHTQTTRENDHRNGS